MKKQKIYLLPGLMTDERLWERLTPYLQDSYELVHIPLPKSCDFEEINCIIEKYFKEEKVNLLGFSLGSYIATYYAIKNPHRIKRVFNLAGSPSATHPIEIVRREIKLKEIEKKGFFTLSYEKAISLLEEKNQNDKKLVKTIVDMFTSLGEENFVYQLKSTFYRKDLHEELKKLQLPIYYFYSKKDRLLNHASIKKLEELKLPHIKLFNREGHSHNIPLEEPELLSKYIKVWLES